MAKSVLIIDSGGTKSDWAFVKGDDVVKGTASGMHPNFLNVEQLTENAKSIDIIRDEVEEIKFYGAGCANKYNVSKIKEALLNVFPAKNIDINHDLLGAARAGLKNQPGFVIILGTGSVGAYYDGESIQSFVGGLGYLFGDEGSGAYMGKILLLKWFKKQLPQSLADKLQAFLKTNEQETIARIYQSERPNHKIASLTYWIKENESHPDLQKIIRENFEAFEKEVLLPLIDKYESKNVIYIGGVANVFIKSIQELSEKHGLNPCVIQKPIDLLVNYHLKIS